MSNSNICSKCGQKGILKGDIGLRTSRDFELIMVMRKDHGVEKKVPNKECLLAYLVTSLLNLS